MKIRVGKGLIVVDHDVVHQLKWCVTRENGELQCDGVNSK